MSGGLCRGDDRPIGRELIVLRGPRRAVMITIYMDTCAVIRAYYAYIVPRGPRRAVVITIYLDTCAVIRAYYAYIMPRGPRRAVMITIYLDTCAVIRAYYAYIMPRRPITSPETSPKSRFNPTTSAQTPNMKVIYERIESPGRDLPRYALW